MKNIIKSSAIIFLSALFVLVPAACSNRTDQKNAGKTAINLSYFIGEFGDEWINELAEEWSDANENYYIDVNTNLNLGGTIVADIRSGSVYDIVITEDCGFQTLFDGDYLEDLSDLLEIKPENDRSISEKILDKDLWLSLAASGEAVYMLPYNISPCGLIFDYDRFRDKGWLMTDETGAITVGKDGIAGTYDDGQPATMAEFRTMCEKIKATGVDDVFLYMGANHPEYVNNVAYAYLAQIIGEENYKIFYTHDSKGKEIELIDGTKTTVSIEDGYKTWQMKGVDTMAEFLQDYLCNSRYVSEATMSDKSISVDTSHTQFIQVDDKAAAFIIEGSWFENGSRSLIESNVRYGGKPYGESDYRYMLLPSEESEKSQIFSQTGGAMLVTKQNDPEKLAAVKDFLVFLLRDENMGKVTAQCGMIWNYTYEIQDGTKQEMTKFTTNVYNMIHDQEHVSVHSPYMEMAATPIYSYSSLGTAGLMLCSDLQYNLIPAFRNATSASQLVLNIINYNTADRWAGYLAQAKSYGFYSE